MHAVESTLSVMPHCCVGHMAKIRIKVDRQDANLSDVADHRLPVDHLRLRVSTDGYCRSRRKEAASTSVPINELRGRQSTWP